MERVERLDDSASARSISRRRLLQAGAAAAALAAVPASAAARKPPRAGAPALDPYRGAIPLIFPLAQGTYLTPVGDNWHQGREGQLYQWNHRNGTRQRAHDGVDIFPASNAALPTAYAPVSGTIVAVCSRPENTVDVDVTYQVSATTPPPWDYSRAIDSVISSPLYGNFVWIRSSEPASEGFFVFVCHLQYESTLQALTVDSACTPATPIGVMGDTGNAIGDPQLHVEIHYPAGTSFTCRHCHPRSAGMTALDAYASLANATPRG